MAFGIDDLLMTAAAGINLCDTLVRTVRNNMESDSVNPGELEALLNEVKANAIASINDANAALNKFERTLVERGADINKPLHVLIQETPMWRPFESFRLSSAKRAFDHFGDNVYRACDDIAALLRCTGNVDGIGHAVVESSQAKREFQRSLINSNSVREAIELLRNQLDRQKEALSR